jgi:outer membrane protein OmpA-like peptidoglycan-associated protein
MNIPYRSSAFFALTLLAPLTAGCSGVVAFEGKTPITVAGDPPPVVKPRPVVKRDAARVVVTDKSIDITEKIQFDLNSPKIKPESDSLLTEIAKVMNDNSNLKKIHIEGHASSDGNPQQNLQLSDARANAVKQWLVTVGKVDKSRLTSKGYGDKQPIADNNTEEGRVANRRVEFKIVERANVAEANK